MKRASMARAYNELPEGYALSESIDLSGNKKQANAVAILSLALAALMAGLGFLIAPRAETAGKLHLAYRIGLAGLLCCAYLVGHEAVHGLVMWGVSRVKPRFGLTLRYAYAGSDVYFTKAPYIAIALAPVIVWGFALALLCALLPAGWFWTCYIVQIVNISGSAGDFYVSARIAGMSGNTLIQDSGTAMRVYGTGITAAA